MCHQFLQVT